MVPIKKLLDTVGTLDTLRLNCANCVKCAMQKIASMHAASMQHLPNAIVSGSWLFLVIR